MGNLGCFEGLKRCLLGKLGIGLHRWSASWVGIRDLVGIAVGGGPSGPSIEGPFCRAVHLCRALGDRKIEKKSKKKQKNNEKRRKN